MLARLVQHFSQVSLRNDRMTEPDLLGRAYEYLIEQFADDAGKKGGEFYTPRMVVKLIVELLAPTERMRICDPTAGSGGMLIECAHYIERHAGNPRNLTLHGQEKKLGTWAICKMNMLLHGLPDARIEGRYDSGPEADRGGGAAAVRSRNRQPAFQSRRVGPRRGRERRLRALPFRRAAEDQGRPGIRPAHGGGAERRRPARCRDAARRALPRQRRGEDPPGTAAGGPLRGGHRHRAESLHTAPASRRRS